jgi:hypothetical protein
MRDSQPHAAAVPTEVHPVAHDTLGEGTRFTFGDHHVTLELYPSGTIFTYHTADSTLSVQVRTTGELVFSHTPTAASDATEAPTTVDIPPTHANVQPT